LACPLPTLNLWKVSVSLPFSRDCEAPFFIAPDPVSASETLARAYQMKIVRRR